MPKLLWSGDVSANHSLSIMSRPVVAALSQVYDVYIREWEHFPGQEVNDQYSDAINALLEKPNPRLTSEDFTIHCKYPMPIFPPDNDSKIVVWQPWEFDHLPEQWKYFLNKFATAAVGICPYNEEIFTKELDGPIIHHISPAVHPVFYEDFVKPYEKETIILYDAGSTWRKGPDVMMALMKRFAGMPEVKFIWKDAAIYKNTNNQWPEIKAANVNCEYLFKNYTFEEMRNLYARADVVVYPTRAEGFGYCPAQALAMGKKVVSPNHTGLDYINNNIAWVVDCKILECPTEYVLSDMFGFKFEKPIHIGEPYPDHLFARTLQAILAKEPKKDRDYLLKYTSKYHPDFVAEQWVEFLETL